MFRLFILSLWGYVWWTVGAVFRLPGKPFAPTLGGRIFLFAAFFPFICLQLMHWAGFALDELLFPGYRKTRVKSPLFICGMPRSGTTFVYRKLAGLTDKFTCFKAWECILAPSIFERRFWKGLAGLDARLGGIGAKALRKLEQLWAGWFGAIYASNLEAPEEDYLTLLPVNACFITGLFYPFAHQAWKPVMWDCVEKREKSNVMGFYYRMLQKHLYEEGEGRRLLSKNAANVTWVEDLAECFDDARFVICIRNPDTAVRSQISSVEPILNLYAERDKTCLASWFADLYWCHYLYITRLLEKGFGECAGILQQEILEKDPGSALHAVFEQIDWSDVAELVEKELAFKPAGSFSSGRRHEYRLPPLDERFNVNLKEAVKVYENLLAVLAQTLEPRG